jgi:MoaA/NifB/PqqE/SkfB family radical SAM enzyme
MVEFQGKNIIIMCCSKCNVQCSHCYIEYDGNLSYGELSDMIDNLSDKYNLSLNGSELLLNHEYLSLFKKINQDRVLTNGLILHNNEKILDDLEESGVHWVCMSYHFSLHNLISPIDKSIVLNNIKQLKQKGFNVEIMTTISNINYKEVEVMVKEAIELEVDCIRFTNLFNEGKAVSLDNEYILTDSQINDFFDQFYMCKQKYGDNILIRRSGTFSRDARKKQSTYYCPIIEETVAVAPNGKVYPCPFLIKSGYEIGKYENGNVYLEEYYENDSSVCMLHEELNRGKSYVKKRY